MNPPIVDPSPRPTPPTVPTEPPKAPELDIDSLVEKIIAKLPKPKDGKDGADGKNGADGKDGEDGKDAPSSEEIIEQLKPLLSVAIRRAVQDAVAGMPQGVTEERIHEIISEYPTGPSLLDVEQMIDSKLAGIDDKMQSMASEIIAGILAIETPIRIGSGENAKDIGVFRLGPDGFTIPSLDVGAGGPGRSAIATMVVVATETERLIREVENAKRHYERITIIPQSQVPANVVVRRYPTLVAYASDGTVAGLWDGQRDVFEKLQAIASGKYP